MLSPDDIFARVAYLERQAEKLKRQSEERVEISKRLSLRAQTLKLIHAELFYGMTVADCCTAFERVDDLMREDYLDRDQAIERCNRELGAALSEDKYQELAELFGTQSAFSCEQTRHIA